MRVVASKEALQELGDLQEDADQVAVVDRTEAELRGLSSSGKTD